MKKTINILCFVIVLSVLSISAQEKDKKLVSSGYIKNLHELSFIDKLEQLDWTTFLHNRLNFKYIPSDEITFRLELRNRIFYGEGVRENLLFSKLISTDNGLVDASWNIVDDKNIVINASIDRALVNYSKGKWDITLGRQRVNWGMNLVWNPNDIFNTYNFLDFDYEERPGSDAIRIQYYIGNFNKIELAAKKGSEKEDYIVSGMYKFNKWEYDIQLITGIYQKDLVFGIGWAGNLKKAGFKGEASYFIPYNKYEGSRDVLSTSVSVDYAFKNGLYVNTSILYNDIANTSEKTINSLMYTQLNAKTLMPFKFSEFIQLVKDFSPIFNGQLNVIHSYKNHSVIIMPTLTYSVAEDWELNFTGQSFFEFKKYETLGSSFFIRLRWSF